MTVDDLPLVSSTWPELAAELKSALHEAEERGLADQIDGLHFVQPCGCDDDFCQSFYTEAPPDGAYGPGHRNVILSPPQPGWLILDVVHDVIMFVEVLERKPLS